MIAASSHSAKRGAPVAAPPDRSAPQAKGHEMSVCRSRSACRSWLLLVCLFGLMLLSTHVNAEETALDRYIAKPDPSYHWKLVATYPGQGQTTFVISLTSQTWRSTDEVNKPVWTHWLTVVRPDKPRPGTAFLFIGGGSFKDPPPKVASPRVAALAAGTNTVVAELSLVPNQPLAFADSSKHGREEDDLVAYSRVKYIITGDEEWLVRLPMVKSGVRAMDCLQEFLATGQDAGPKTGTDPLPNGQESSQTATSPGSVPLFGPPAEHLKIDHFVVAGGSKRGWTTWLIGTVDPRVVAIIPLVIDALNSEKITQHHFEAYGFFSPSLKDYVHHGIFPYRIGTPEYRKVLAIEDPYSYRDRERLKIPKFLINAAGDQFFLPDGSQFYFADLPPEKHLRYTPNAKHNLKGSDALESLQAFYQAILDNHPRPHYWWKKEPNGDLHVIAEGIPREVNLWQATNPNARDFRLDVIGKAWHSTPLVAPKPGDYLAHVPAPSTGYTAFFVELVYDSGGKYPFKFTTEVSVVPDVLPYKWKDAKAKLGPPLKDID
jgi:PhoPQ-activated pathogenicity-related protein